MAGCRNHLKHSPHLVFSSSNSSSLGTLTHERVRVFFFQFIFTRHCNSWTQRSRWIIKYSIALLSMGSILLYRSPVQSVKVRTTRGKVQRSMPPKVQGARVRSSRTSISASQSRRKQLHATAAATTTTTTTIITTDQIRTRTAKCSNQCKGTQFPYSPYASCSNCCIVLCWSWSVRLVCNLYNLSWYTSYLLHTHNAHTYTHIHTRFGSGQPETTGLVTALA